MNDTLLNVARFAFVFILPIALTAGAAVALFSLGALFYVLDHPEELKCSADEVESPTDPVGFVSRHVSQVPSMAP